MRLRRSRRDIDQQTEAHLAPEIRVDWIAENWVDRIGIDLVQDCSQPVEFLLLDFVDAAVLPFFCRAHRVSRAARHGQIPRTTAHARQLAETARIAAIEIIRYPSVGDPNRRMNLALLTCGVFRNAQPASLQTWRIRLSATGAQAICESPKSGLAFDRAAFAADPRIAALKWDR